MLDNQITDIYNASIWKQKMKSSSKEKELLTE